MTALKQHWKLGAISTTKSSEIFMVIDNKISLKGMIVWGVCALFFMYEFLLRTILGTFQYPLMHDLHLSPVSFALISSTAYQIMYGSMQIPVGIITDRFGIKRTCFFAVIICAIGTLGFSMTHHFSSAIANRLLMGFGSSFGFICLLVAVYDWMPRKNIALFIGLSQFIGTMGPMLAAGPMNSIASSATINWRTIFIILAVIGGFIGILVLLFVDKNRKNQGKFIVLSRPSTILSNLRRLMGQKETWFIALYSSCVYFAIEYLSENEGVEFLRHKGFASGFASYMITLAWFGYAIGCPSLGFISDKLQRRKPILIACSLIGLTALTGIIYLSLNALMTSICFIFLGIGASGQSLGFATMAEQCKEDYLAVGLGFNNGMMMLFASINAPLIGWILSHVSQAGNVRLADYHEAFGIIIVLGIAAVLISTFLIKETFCKSVKENTPLNPNIKSAE